MDIVTYALAEKLLGSVDKSCFLLHKDSSFIDLIEENTITGGGEPPYTPLSYIQSNGNQYIDTGIKCTEGVGYDAKLEFISFGTNYYGIDVFGADAGRSDGRGRWGLNVRSAHNELWMFNFNATSTEQSMITPDNQNPFYPTSQINVIKQPFTSSLLNSILSMNEYSKQCVAGSGDAPYVENLNVFLFKANLNGSGTQGNPSLKLYWFKLYQGSSLVRDFIPCQDSNNVYCLLDKVSGQFFYNLGTGNFTGA